MEVLATKIVGKNELLIMLQVEFIQFFLNKSKHQPDNIFLNINKNKSN